MPVKYLSALQKNAQKAAFKVMRLYVFILRANTTGYQLPQNLSWAGNRPGRSRS